MVGRSIREIVWARLRRDKVAMVCLGILIFYIVLAVIGPNVLNALGWDPYTLHQDDVNPKQGGLPVLPFGGISAEHPLGVESGTGRDIMAQLVNGLRLSLIIATSATLLTTLVGVVVGMLAGYFGGLIDTIAGRLMDLVLAFPFLLLILALSNPLTQRLVDLGVPEGNESRVLYLILAFSLFGWAGLGRLVRGQVLSIREREFVEAAVAMGAGRRRILFGEILPNLWAPILVYATLTLPAYIAFEAAISFLGVSVQAPDVTFGGMLASSVRFFNVVPTYLFIPGTVLVVLVVAFNLLGDALRDALDPKSAR
jgi:peptide/nickel transport system permease protein